ncbi:hypothetical protein BOTBODRAFT_503327 [Botryobasidium botryosum FD-172 SS1]|uniref:Uncharacterized protein n=1 Tax=Botryobasidium botryosum (strain FD-172 SS1) TaxID=930990 RepID=A0A067M358_BOTB1|nr:hypothetical protein BOTBODRAFT_503327 [Botryobasidium botryosum FD-172 SS1]
MAINWSDPAEVVRDSQVFVKTLIFFLGLYMWEVFFTIGFDWQVITRKKEFKWPMGFYFWCKYSLLLSIIGVNVASNITSEVNCQALYTFNQFAGNTAIGTASTLLMFRTIAVWSKNIYVVVPLCVLSMGQWGIILHGIVTIQSSWSPEAMTCIVEGTQPAWINAIYLYTMSFDLIVLILSTIGLLLSPGRSNLWQLLFKDGIVFFLIAFCSNLFPAVFSLMNLNAAMNIICSVPAATCSTIVACRSFVRLSEFTNKDVYVHTSMPYNTKTPMPATRSSHRKTGAEPIGVHITMDTYARHDIPSDEDRMSTPTYDLESGTDKKAHV